MTEQRLKVEEGGFLWNALERGAGAVAGIDIDPVALKRARELLQGPVPGKIHSAL
ncbi:MAG: hypothetical protein RMK16_00690 [Acidobacteriota bacterium]|nr:hypothetical protein [Acidobacteriota bacterium]